MELNKPLALMPNTFKLDRLQMRGNTELIERFIHDMQKQLPNLDFEGKRLAMDMLDITVYLDGESVEITGVISPEDSSIVFTSSQ